MFHKFFLFLLLLFLFVICISCKGQVISTDEYVYHDGFLTSRVMTEASINDTVLIHGRLSDGTFYFVYPNRKSDYPFGSCVIERALGDRGQALVVVGNINPVLAIDGLEAIVQTPDSIGSVPLYTDHNYHGLHSLIHGREIRIDLRLLFYPRVPAELRDSPYALIHECYINVIASLINARLNIIQGTHRLPQSIESIHAYSTHELNGVDKEYLCFFINSRAGMEKQAKDDAMQCLKLLIRDPVTENELILAREYCRIFLIDPYYDRANRPGESLTTSNSLLAKRIADAFVSGHEYYDFHEEGLFVKKVLASIDSEMANAMLRSTVMGKGKE